MKTILAAIIVVSTLMTASAGAQDAGPPREQTPAAAADPATQPAAHAAAIEYSHGYEVRAKIHKYASVTMLPLFGADVLVGQSLYNSSSDSKKGVHVALGAGIGGLFAVNTVTGAWNLIESRKDPNKRGVKLLHGLMMLGADAGFLATGMMTPESEHGLSDVSADKRTHRTIAFTSMGLATAS
jgi:hypothetical protein